MIKKIITKIVIVVDYLLFVFVFISCLIALLFAIPWISKQRKTWNHSVKGNNKAIILRGFTLEKLYKRGYDHLLPFRNPSLKWIGFLDATNSTKTTIKITDDLYIIIMQTPNILRVMEKLGFMGTSTIVRELIAIFRITGYCVQEQIGVLRAYKHTYPALQAYLVSRFIKIPFIVDISGHYEVIRKLTGKTFYFRELNKLPVLRIFSLKVTNWLYGLPLRHACWVVGRDKWTFEYARSLGVPVERLSFLRISNFSAAFNSYNPEKLPTKPVEYPYLLLVGRLAEIHFPLDVLDAFEQAAAQVPEYRLVIIGDGSLRNDVEQRRERSEYKDRIVLLGACSSTIVFQWTAHAKAAICPLAGSTMAEAMLCGVPVIAYFLKGYPEMVIDDYTGYTVPFRDITALAQKMISVVHNYDEAMVVGMRGREAARIAFDKKKISEKESMYYMQALTEP